MNSLSTAEFGYYILLIFSFTILLFLGYSAIDQLERIRRNRSKKRKSIKLGYITLDAGSKVLLYLEHNGNIKGNIVHPDLVPDISDSIIRREGELAVANEVFTAPRHLLHRGKPILNDQNEPVFTSPKFKKPMTKAEMAQKAEESKLPPIAKVSPQEVMEKGLPVKSTVQEGVIV